MPVDAVFKNRPRPLESRYGPGKFGPGRGRSKSVGASWSGLLGAGADRCRGEIARNAVII